MASMSSYAILGCGSVGHAVAEELVAEGKTVLILDADESRVEALRDQDLDAHHADIKNEEVAERVADHDVILILSSDVDANRAAVENIRSRDGDPFIVVRASDPVTANELTELGVDVVINPSDVIADSALRALETGELEYKAERLAEVIDSGEHLAILAHRSPDPDSIASAVALQAIASELDVEAEAGREVVDEENDHADLWKEWRIELPETDEVPALTALLEGLDGMSASELAGALHAYEVQQPEVCETKKKGLLEHYGFDEDPLTFFDEHIEGEEQHIVFGRNIREEYADPDAFDRGFEKGVELVYNSLDNFVAA